jgi:hypothetical protein
MKRLNSLLLVLLVFCLGCATIKPTLLEKPVEREKIYNKPYDDVWKAAMAVFVKSEGIISTIDSQSGIISFVNNMSPAEMEDFIAEKAPAFPMGSSFGQGQMYINAIFSKVDASNTKVYLKTKIVGSLLNAYGYPIQYNISLTSNGKLEEEFFNKISAESGLIQYDYLKSQ